jgi:hypothetical protein
MTWTRAKRQARTTRTTSPESRSDQSYLYFKYAVYHKLAETFHNVSECKTAIYFSWWVILQLRWPGDLWPLNLWYCFTFDRLRITLSNRDRTRPYKTINITISDQVKPKAIFLVKLWKSFIKIVHYISYPVGNELIPILTKNMASGLDSPYLLQCFLIAWLLTKPKESKKYYFRGTPVNTATFV